MQPDRPDIVILPPLALLIAVAAAFALHLLAPLGLLPPFPWGLGLWLGCALMAAGIAIGVAGIVSFRRAGTNVVPLNPTLKIVRSGPYRFTRNPMYLGMIVGLAGLGLAASNTWALILTPALWATYHWGVVLPEEAYLERKFGEDYRALLTETRRWL